MKTKKKMVDGNLQYDPGTGGFIKNAA